MRRLRTLDPGRVAILLVLIVATAALLGRDQWSWIFAPDDPQTVGVVAEQIDPSEIDPGTERLYRISPDNGSAVSYRVQERLAGASRTAVGSSTVVAGDVLVNLVDPSLSEVGEIVVNVEMFESDSNLRDKRIRHDFLESTHFPFARFAPTSIEGLDAVLGDGDAGDASIDGRSFEIAITGELTIKETTLTQTFNGTVTVDPDRLVASMTATVLSSAYDVGPINIARLTHTSDEVELIFELVADRVEISSNSTTDLRREIPAVEFVSGAFAADVAPILETKCVSCHTEGGPGWSTLAFDTAGQAAEVAQDIALVTETRFMPPWLPSDLSPAFEHDWSLSDDEIAVISNWAEDGGGLDVAPDTQLVPRVQAVLAIEEDQKIPPRDGPYTGYSDAEGNPVKADDYRCQVHEVADPEGDGNWLKGFEFRPDQTSVVHHSIVYRVPASAAAEVQAKIAAQDEIEADAGLSDEPGWTCFGLSGLWSEGVYSIQGWAPGQSPTTYPDGYGIYLSPGDMIVNQIHYHYDHDTPADGSWIILDTATPEEVSAGLTHITGSTYLTPAEVPCTPAEMATAQQRAETIDGYVNLCIRENVLKDIGEKYDLFATFIPDGLIALCGGTVDDYDDLDGSIGYSSCDMRARNDGTIHTVLGHMHEFGAAYRMTLNPDTREERILLDIPVWDFEWQLNYEPIEDIRIATSDIVRFECWWDRSLKYLPEPRYITWNEGTVDEMCFSSISVLPDN